MVNVECAQAGAGKPIAKSSRVRNGDVSVAFAVPEGNRAVVGRHWEVPALDHPGTFRHDPVARARGNLDEVPVYQFGDRDRHLVGFVYVLADDDRRTPASATQACPRSPAARSRKVRTAARPSAC